MPYAGTGSGNFVNFTVRSVNGFGGPSCCRTRIPRSVQPASARPKVLKGTNRNSAQIRMEEYPMKRVIELAIVASVVLLLGGCATKKYVAKQTDPITAKVNEV